MKNRYCLLILFYCLRFSLAGQSLEASRLPIVRINTNGWLIFDEPKIPSTLSIIYRGAGVLNKITDTALVYDGRMAIELRGKTSQLLSEKKPYAIELRGKKEEKNSVSLLGMPAEHDWVLLAPYSDKSLLRDIFGFDLANHFTRLGYVPRMRFVEVEINDEYKGVYVLGEKVKRSPDRINITDFNEDSLSNSFIIKIDKESGFVANEFWNSHVPPRWALDKQGIRFLFHQPKPEKVTPKQSVYVKKWMRSFEDTLLSANFANPRGGYRSVLDTGSFIDFFLMNELCRNVDGLRISTFFHKNDDRTDPHLHAGPVWDFNLSFGNADYCNGSLTEGWSYDFNKICGKDYWLVPFWWERLREDPVFRQRTAERWANLRKTTLSDPAIRELIGELKEQLTDGPADRNFKQWDIIGKKIWPNSFVGKSWEEEVEFLLNWTLKRAAWLDEAVLK